MAGYRPQNSGNRTTQRFGATASRRLRAAGFNISPSARRYKHDGVFVAGRGDFISVLVDLPARSVAVANKIAETVRGWGMDAEVTVVDEGRAALVHFTYRAASKAAARPVEEKPAVAPATETQQHDGDTCMDLDCEECVPEYIPQVGDLVKDVMGNVWRVTSTSGRFIELRHTVHGHFADAPKTPAGGFKYGRYEKLEAVAA